MKKLLFYITFMALLTGGTFIWLSTANMIRGTKTPVDLNSLSPVMLEPNLIVEGELECNYGAFVEEYNTRYGIKTSESVYKYLIPIGEYEYIGIEPLNDSMEVAFDRQVEETLAYIYEETDSYPETVHVIGRIKKLDNQSLGYMKEYLLYMGYTQEEANRYACPYYLDCETYSNWGPGLVIGIVLLLIGIVLLVITFISSRKKPRVTVAPTLPEVGTDYSNFTPYEPSTHTGFSEFDKSDLPSQETNTDDNTDDINPTSNFSFKLDDN